MYVRAQIVIKGVHLKRGPDLQAAYWLHFHRSSHQLQLYAGVARTTSRGDSRGLGELYCMRTEIHVGWGSFSRLAWKHQDFLIKHYNKNVVHFQCLCNLLALYLCFSCADLFPNHCCFSRTCSWTLSFVHL